MADFLCFGELMLRLKAPGHERFFQSPQFEATFGGGEANVAVALANYGLSAGFVSALPANAIGEAAVRELHSFGVDTNHLKRTGQRMGIYYLEAGANQRPSKVIYDRAGSSLSAMQPGDFDWPAIFADAKWLPEFNSEVQHFHSRQGKLRHNLDDGTHHSPLEGESARQGRSPPESRWGDRSLAPTL